MTRTLSLLAVLTLLMTSTVFASVPEPFVAQYDISFSGLGGEITSTLTKTDKGRYVFENRTRARGIARLARPRDAVERSEFLLIDGRLQPVEFTSEDGTRRNKRGNNIAFDWQKGVARSDYEEEVHELELSPEIVDRQLMQLAMMSDLTDGKKEVTYSVIHRHEINDYEMSFIANETITVPAGEYATVKVERQRPGSSRTIIMWCAPALQYLPVRMEQLKEGKVIATLELTDFR